MRQAMKRKIFIGFMTALFLLTIFSFAPQNVFAQPKKAKKLVTDGDKFFQQKDYQSAIDKYAEAIVIAPNYPNAYFWKGTAHYYLKQYDQAAQDLSTALAQGYKQPNEIYKVRAYVYFDKRDYDAALGDMQQNVLLEPSNVNHVLALGEIYINKKDWANALTTYKRAAQLDAQNGNIDYFLAFISNQNGDYSAQGSAAASALRKGTKYIGESHYLYGEAQQRERNSLEAMQSYERALNAKPDIYPAYALLSELYRGQGRFNDAINITTKGLEIFKNDGSMYINLAWYYSLADKHDEAVEAGLKAVENSPDSSLGYTNLCRAYNDIREYTKAIEICNKALSISPNDGETNFYLGRSYSFLNRKDTAEKYYAKAVEGLLRYTADNPEYSDGFYLLGNAYFANGKRDKAIEAYKRCLDLSPRFAKARYNLGYIYYLENNPTAARQQYEELKKFDAVTAEKLKQAMEKK